MTYLERAFVRRGYPKHIIVAVVGAIWGLYFLWLHNWIWAAGIVLLSGILGRILTMGTREERLAETTLGKIMLLHLHLLNLTIQLAGSVFLIYGIWIHSAIRKKRLDSGLYSKVYVSKRGATRCRSASSPRRSA